MKRCPSSFSDATHGIKVRKVLVPLAAPDQNRNVDEDEEGNSTTDPEVAVTSPIAMSDVDSNDDDNDDDEDNESQSESSDDVQEGEQDDMHQPAAEPVTKVVDTGKYYWDFYKRKYLIVVRLHILGHKVLLDHKLYEYLWALKLKMVMYNDVPPAYLQMFGIDDCRDFGTDLACIFSQAAAQVKFYAEGNTITYEDISKQHTHSDLLGAADNRILCTTPGARLARNAKKVINMRNYTVHRESMGSLLESAKTLHEESFGCSIDAAIMPRQQHNINNNDDAEQTSGPPITPMQWRKGQLCTQFLFYGFVAADSSDDPQSRFFICVDGTLVKQVDDGMRLDC